MGLGIAQLAADVAQFNVVAVDTNKVSGACAAARRPTRRLTRPARPLEQAALDKGMKGIEDSLKKLHGKRLAAEPDAAAKTDAAVKAAMGRITTSTDVSALKDCSTLRLACVAHVPSAFARAPGLTALTAARRDRGGGDHREPRDQEKVGPHAAKTA
jgi:hypothetical protein